MAMIKIAFDNQNAGKLNMRGRSHFKKQFTLDNIWYLQKRSFYSHFIQWILHRKWAEMDRVHTSIWHCGWFLYKVWGLSASHRASLEGRKMWWVKLLVLIVFDVETKLHYCMDDRDSNYGRLHPEASKKFLTASNTSARLNSLLSWKPAEDFYQTCDTENKVTEIKLLNSSIW